MMTNRQARNRLGWTVALVGALALTPALLLALPAPAPVGVGGVVAWMGQMRAATAPVNIWITGPSEFRLGNRSAPVFRFVSDADLNNRLARARSDAGQTGTLHVQIDAGDHGFDLTAVSNAACRTGFERLSIDANIARDASAKPDLRHAEQMIDLKSCSPNGEQRDTTRLLPDPAGRRPAVERARGQAMPSRRDTVPVVDLSAPAVSWQGMGVARSNRTPSVDTTKFEYQVAMLDTKPNLINRTETAALIDRLYPSELRAAGTRGVSLVQFVIQPDGLIDPTTLKVVSSSDERLEIPSVLVVERFRFQPGTYQGKPVRVLVQMPITWQPKPPPPPAKGFQELIPPRESAPPPAH